MRQLLVTERTVADLREIWLYSFEKWGDEQADRYLDELEAGLEKCRTAPESGKQRDNLRSGYWSRIIRRHVAFYTFTDEEVVVQRVLHGSMDASLHLDDE